MTAPALQALKDTATEHFASIVEEGETSGLFDVAPPKVSGSPSRSYRLRISVDDARATAREETPRHLPKFCAERHIDPGGSFCLSWPARDPLTVIDRESASRWWATLLVFLNHQETAERLKRWPGPARAHGDAASAQEAALAAVEALGERFRFLLADGRLSTYRGKGRLGRKTMLLLDRKRLLAVDGRRRRVLRRRGTSCPCSIAPEPLRSVRACGKHEQALVALTLALEAWRVAEAEFTRGLIAAGVKCCGTVRECPLQA